MLIANGESDKQAASQLFVVESTIKSHVKNIYQNTQTHSRLKLRELIYEKH